MNKPFATALLAATLGAAFASPALAADIVSETRKIDARAVKIHVDGAISVYLKQGPTASLVVSGEKDFVPRITTSQSGDTLEIGTSLGWFNKGKHSLRAELTLPNLREIVAGGVGSTEVSGFTGDDVKIALDGAGKMTVTSQYRKVDATLGGVGNMTLNTGASDSVDLRMRGAGNVEMSGQSKVLRAKLNGVGNLDAQKLLADAIDVDMSGTGNASVYAKTSANMNLTGIGKASVYGKPASRNASARGLGSVTWE